MVVVDPSSTKTFDNINISVSNASILNENNLSIYPELDISTSIKLYGKLSNLEKIKKDSIQIYVELRNAIEGKNEIYLKASVPNGVTYELKDTTAYIELEKIIEENKDIEIFINDEISKNIDTVDLDFKSTKVSGPRTLIKKLDKIVAIIDVNSIEEDLSLKIPIKAFDFESNEMFDIKLEEKDVTANIKVLKEKSIPIKLMFTDKDEKREFILSEKEVIIKGKQSLLDTIEFIETKPIDSSNDFKINDTYDISLEIPEGITLINNNPLNIKLK